MVLDSSARERIVRALRIVGASGAGKTALAERIAADATASGWLVVCAPSFRLHATLPLFSGRRVIQALIDGLGESAQRYRSGLTLDREKPEDFEEAFLRIVEGVTLDHRLLLILDDAQWADSESRRLFERTASALADRAIVLISTERSDESSERTFGLADEAIALGELPQQVAVQIVRAIYPGVSDDIAIGIAAETGGRAVDIVAVATAAREGAATTLRDVSASTRRVVARDLSLLDARVREFLQVCALIDEPIELPLLQQLFPKEELLQMIERLSGRYLVSNADGLRFVHATVMESVLETIPIAIPLRYRVLEALKKLPGPRLEDYERMVTQSAACGDPQAEREALIKLSDEAAAKSLISLSASSLERAIAIAPPPPSDIAPTYARLSQMYNALARESDAIRVSRRALAEAEAAGTSEGLGPIAASIVLAQWHAGLASEARSTLARYEQAFSSPADRANFSSLGEYIAMHCVDIESASVYRDRYNQHAAHADVMVAIRHEVTNAFLAMRVGNEVLALEHLNEAERLCVTAPPIFASMPRSAKLLHGLRYRGTHTADQLLSQLRPDTKLAIATAVQGHVMIARGEFTDLEEIIGERLQSPKDSLMQGLLSCPRYTAAALRGVPAKDAIWQLAHYEVAAFEAGERTLSALPVVTASLVPLATQSPQRACKLLADAIAASSAPTDVMLFSYPVLLSIAARTLDAREELKAIASGALWTDAQPWNVAHHSLARGVASAALRQSESAEILQSARDRFAELDAPYFVSVANGLLGTASVAAHNATQPRPNNTTRRECEIAGLVAEGLTNREIAERLVLSERTVEGHIANLFAKVNVNSRTQLATWFMRTSSAAS